jgi:phosphoribosylformimino-5-aminoimidazole carboxamide ribotide isomerase
MMQLYPAIDLMDGQVVRLEQGRADRKTVYSNDPPGFARHWDELGGHWLHVVDLDAAFTGRQKNLEIIRAIAREVSIPVQTGGGLRSLAAIEKTLEAGLNRVVIGTKAAESLEFVEEAVKNFGGEQIAVGIDARDGVVAVRGWTESSGVRAVDLARQVLDAGARTVIYTDIATDGMLKGPNMAELRKLNEALDLRIIASGGVSTLENIQELNGFDPPLHGAIIGKALYDERVDLRQARKLVDDAA